MKVDFFIVGAPKAGTSSIFQLLKMHPEVCMSELKEPNYFSYAEVSKLYKSRDYQDSVFKFESDSHYHTQFSDLSKVCGEASVSYLIYPDVAKRIKAYNQNAKVLIFLRDPVDRAISHYRMDRRLGFTDKSIAEILNQENSVEFFQYINGSHYSQQIIPYLDEFPRENIKIIEFRELIDKPEKVALEIQKFLKLQAVINALPNENTGFDTENWLLKKMYKSKKIRESLKKYAPKVMVNSIKKLLKANNSGSTEISTDVKDKIYECVKHDIEKLEKISFSDMSHWHRKS